MNLGVISQGHRDASTYYRADGVLAYLRQMADVRLVVDTEWHYQKLMQCDAVFMHRPWIDGHRNVAEMCKTLNIPLWIDYDDDQFSLNRYNDFHDEFMQPHLHDNMRRISELASAISVSTEALLERYPKAVVIPNALNDYVWKLEPSNPKKVITWRGGATHVGDLEPFMPAIGRVANDYPDWDWHFFGCPHWNIESVVPNDQLHRHKWADPFSFMKEFRSVAPAVHIVPLADNRFNRCKSNCAWLEATYAGAAVVAPAWPEWSRFGVTCYDSADSFESCLRGLLDDPPAWKLWNEESRNVISESLLLSHVNKLRVDLLSQIVPSLTLT